VHIAITGIVQGVYFRAFVKDRALELDLKGYVKNIDRNKLEAIIEGHEAKIKKLIELIKKGPPGSEVNEIKVTKQQFQNEFNQFKVKY